MIMITRTTTTASIATGGGPTTASTLASLITAHLTDDDDLKTDLLKSQLVARTPQESHRTLRRLIRGTEFDANGLIEKVRKIFLHLPIENEGDIRIEFLLKLKELALAKLPGTGLEHCKNQNILAGVMRKGIEHPGSFQSSTCRRRIRAG
jgi:hypothetical protein